uniref:Transposase-associated domain-containing protein n=1 Tax=Fagus sylvatica TaxID=28930 RepID=A0A2N9GFA6_FAGSY
MPVDKSWINLPSRSCHEYVNGVEKFVEYAFQRIKDDDMKIKCLCNNCSNWYRRTQAKVERHLLWRGMRRDYIRWHLHGEGNSEDDEEDSDEDEDDSSDDQVQNIDDIPGMIRDAYPHVKDGEEASRSEPQEPNEDAKKFYRLLEESEKPLYEGCEKYSNLAFIVKLMHIKCINCWSNNSFNMLLELLKDAFPMCETLPTSNYGAKKIIGDLGLHYEKIDACENDCMLYYKENSKANQCSICHLSRWKTNNKDGKGNGKKVPWKVLRYFPLKPRLQRLFMSMKTVADMRWHHDERLNDGVLRHPADAEAWKSFNRIHESFSLDPRNVRVSLATDGFNPFGNMNISHSSWPVILFPYNIPPWMCMKEPYLFMSLLIPGPKGPGNDIDVYLRPLIDELKDLWEIGAYTYDASMQENFQMRVALMWTINDFTTYAYTSGWSTQGHLACPCCGNETEHCKQQRLDGRGKSHNWKKRSIFFDLLYWSTLSLHHNLEVMHIEKNVCDNVIGSVLDIQGKTKDSLYARLDLQEMGIRKELHPKLVDGKNILPLACYTLSNVEQRAL